MLIIKGPSQGFVPPFSPMEPWGSAPGTDHLRSTYDLEKVLGRGAVGTVYKATRRADARQVVVKVRNVIDDKAPQTTGGGGKMEGVLSFVG